MTMACILGALPHFLLDYSFWGQSMARLWGRSVRNLCGPLASVWVSLAILQTSLQPNGLTATSQRPWARDTHLRCALIPTHRNGEIIHICCSKPPSFRVICYISINNTVMVCKALSQEFYVTFYSWRNWVTKMLHHCPTPHIYGRGGTQTQAVWLQSVGS